jgi:hypothetical protein
MRAAEGFREGGPGPVPELFRLKDRIFAKQPNFHMKILAQRHQYSVVPSNIRMMFLPVAMTPSPMD